MRYHWTLIAVPASCVHDRWLRSIDNTPGSDGARLATEHHQPSSVRQHLSPLPTEAPMRAVSLVAVAATVSLVLLSTSPVALAAQKKGVSAFDGVWREVEVHDVRPDSTVTRPPAQGVCVIVHG